MNRLVRTAKDTLKALNVELADAEQSEEIALPEGTLGLARDSLSAA